MKKAKRNLALALAFVMVGTLLPFLEKGGVKAEAAGTTVTWTAKTDCKPTTTAATTVEGTKDSVSGTYNETTQQQAVASLKFEKDGLVVAPLPQTITEKTADGVTKTTINVWKSSGDYLTGTDNARNASGGAVSKAEAAPVAGTALKVNVTSNGVVQAVVQGGGTTALNNLKNIHVTSFTTGETTNGEEIWTTLTNFDSNKGDVTCEFNAEPGKDYYIFVNGSKASFKSVTYTAGESKICATVDCLKTLGAAYREKTPGWSNGIRFGSVFDATTVKKTENGAVANIDVLTDVETGTLVALESTMNEKGITELTLDESQNAVAGLKVKRTTKLADSTSTSLQYSVAIVNIPEERQEINFVARPYVISDGQVYYGDQISASWDEIKAQATAQQ